MKPNHYNTVRKGRISSDDLLVLQKATRALLKHGYDPIDFEFWYLEHFANVLKIQWWIIADCTSNGESFKVFIEFEGTHIKNLTGKITRIQREEYDPFTGCTSYENLETVQ